MSNYKFRKAELRDAESILKVYEYYIKNTAITFEWTIPSIEEFRTRIEKTLKKYPYIVVEKDSEIIGYCYTGPFVGREAYDWSAQTSIYIKNSERKKGLGKKLYQLIENISKAQNIINLYACIGYPEKNDEYLTKNSAEFHEHLGYKLMGKFENCGYKFNKWYHMVWMGKVINELKDKPDPLIPFAQFSEEKLLELGLQQ